MTTKYEQITTRTNGTWLVKDHLLYALHIWLQWFVLYFLKRPILTKMFKFPYWISLSQTL